MSNRYTIPMRCFLGLSIVIGLVASVAHAETHASLAKRIARAVHHPAFTPAQTSVAVADASSGTVIASVNPDLLLNPASCAKIVTTAAALTYLGPDHRFITSFATDRKDAHGIIGNLYVRGDGDPTLVEEGLWKMVNDLAQAGVARIDGDIVIDNTYFDGTSYPKKDVDHGRAFTAPTSAVAVNFNATIIAQTLVDDELEATYRSTIDPVTHAGEILLKLLRTSGIAVRGGVRSTATPANAIPLLRAESKPLALIVRDMNKFSNNFIAEQLLKHLGAVRKGAPGSTAKGTQVLAEYLAGLGIKRGSYTLENGSGFSDRTALSARQLLTVLTAAYRDFSIGPDMVASFSILGSDGTMRRWKVVGDLEGRLRAKTGSLAGVSALAGYVTTGDGQVMAFVILANGVRQGFAATHEALLAIVENIAHNEP